MVICQKTGVPLIKGFYVCHGPVAWEVDECPLLSHYSGAVGILNLTLLGPLFREALLQGAVTMSTPGLTQSH